MSVLRNIPGGAPGVLTIAFAAVALAVFAAPLAPSQEPASAELAPVPSLPVFDRHANEQALVEITQRPLFSRDRRPSMTAAADGAIDSFDNFRLAGTITAGVVRKALFVERNNANDYKSVWKQAGEFIGAARIVSIEPGQVVVFYQGAEKTLSTRKAERLTPKQRSQKRAATPIYMSSAKSTPAENARLMAAFRDRVAAMKAATEQQGQDE